METDSGLEAFGLSGPQAEAAGGEEQAAEL